VNTMAAHWITETWLPDVISTQYKRQVRVYNTCGIVEVVKSRLRLGSVCYHSVQNLLSPRLLSKNLKIKIYKTIILPVVLYG